MSSSEIIIAFDLYGTILSTESISKELATHFGDKADSISALWRRYQLEYTWRLNSMNLYKPFDEITQKSLEHALAESKVSLSSKDFWNLLKAYDNLTIFPDAKVALESLRSSSTCPKITPYIFSNGTPKMVTTSLTSSPTLSPFSFLFASLITTSPTQSFKPSPIVYQHLASSVGKSISKEDMGKVWLVSGNPFDAVGAKAAGLRAAWVDRAGGHHGEGGWNDRLGELVGVGSPDLVVKGVDEAVEGIRRWCAENC